MNRSLAVPILLACLALTAVGCGSSSSPATTTTTTTTTSSSSSSSSSTPPASGSPSAGANRGGATGQVGKGKGGASQGGASQEGAQGGSSSPTGGSGSSASGADNSIQTYGSEAASAQKTALTAAAHSFFAAMATRDYAKVCDGLTASNRAQLKLFLKASHKKGGCPTVLKALMPRATPEARKAAAGKVTSVRVKGSTAFVLFRPKGGVPSYFVMKREGAAWKAISPAPGTPLNPLAGVRK